MFGAAISLAGIGRPADTGTLVAIVHATGSTQTLTDATIEILTPQNALVATLTPDADGRATQALREGVYLVRVSHPRYAADVHRIQVQPGHTIEIRSMLRAGSSSSSSVKNAFRKALGLDR